MLKIFKANSNKIVQSNNNKINKTSQIFFKLKT